MVCGEKFEGSPSCDPPEMAQQFVKVPESSGLRGLVNGSISDCLLSNREREASALVNRPEVGILPDSAGTVAKEMVMHQSKWIRLRMADRLFGSELGTLITQPVMCLLR